MSRLALPFAKVLALVALCACGTETPPEAKSKLCAEVDCGPGQCTASSGQAACSCPEGYVPAGASCKRDVREGDDHGDFLAAATPVEPGTQGTGQLDIDTDLDLFSFRVTAGRIYRFVCYPESGGYSSSCTVTLLGADGLALPLAKSWNGLHYLSGVLATEDGTLYARVKFSPLGDTGRGRGYTYALLDLGPDDFADIPAEATVVAPGTTVSGRIELNDDLDVFALDAVAGRSYRLSCQPSPRYCLLRLRSPQGEVLQTQTTTIDLTGAQAGRYTVEVGARPDLFLTPGVNDYVYSPVDLGP